MNYSALSFIAAVAVTVGTGVTMQVAQAERYQTLSSEVEDLIAHGELALSLADMPGYLTEDNRFISSMSIKVVPFETNPVEEVDSTAEDSVHEFTRGFELCSYEDIYSVQVNKSYKIPKEFYYEVLPETMHPLVDSVCELEDTMEISSMYLFAVAATEVGWGTAFAEDNNWFNWTPNAEDYQYFSCASDCVDFTQKMYEIKFFNADWYAGYGQTMDDYYTIQDINSRYALYSDGSVNWYWSDVVGEIMYSLNKKYQSWTLQNTI